MPANLTYKCMVDKTRDLITETTSKINILEPLAQGMEATGRVKRDLEDALETLHVTVRRQGSRTAS